MGKAAGTPNAQLRKEAEIGELKCYRWCKQYQGLGKPDAKRLKGLKRENARLKCAEPAALR